MFNQEIQYDLCATYRGGLGPLWRERKNLREKKRQKLEFSFTVAQILLHIHRIRTDTEHFDAGAEISVLLKMKELLLLQCCNKPGLQQHYLNMDFNVNAGST